CKTCAKDLRAILGARAPEPTVSQRVPRVAGGVVEKPAARCHLCNNDITKLSVSSGRALVHEGHTYCSTCKGEVQKVLEMSKLSCERLVAFTCTTCNAAIQPEALLEDKALRYKGQIYCAECAKNVGKPAR